ncbi:ROK family transcriptional regulator [Streptomyces pluripotens]|uniref:ROK family transcriptional regulator n=1 Tax=Streptomyces pluripotens TaxID=1355015 RepID=A0A221NXG2_9ACTN|nr:ROK family transcriptional regulator [Streptomyces sp. MUM 16J]ASN24657.1 ROK family transcriptional regulator [Streptomyces pluripotens]MCH0558859.1 ROK family transcriptional regulator [Streptomyces sp. MUM 16J]
MGGVNRATRSSGPAGANLGAVRSHNTALVLGLLRDAGGEGISRLELAERTGLTPQAVSKIMGRLREEGLVAEAGRQVSTGGKPRTVLRLVPEAGHAVGVHLDRDELRVVLVDLDGAVVAERGGDLDLGAEAEVVLGAVGDAVRVLVRDGLGPAGREASGGGLAGLGGVARSGGLAGFGPLLGVGVALPGPLDHVRGVLHRVTGFPRWNGFPLRDALAEWLGVPVVVDKDTNAAALGLAVTGAAGSGNGSNGNPRGSFAYLHLGSGLGAGLVFDGRVHRGARTGAGEFGHQVIQLDGPLCECGNQGCVEALCLGAVARGDAAEAARVLGVAAGNLVGLLDIDVVLLGGRTVAGAPEAYVRGVGEVLEARARRAGAPAGRVPVRVAPCGERVVAEGAAQLLLAPLFGRGAG